MTGADRAAAAPTSADVVVRTVVRAVRAAMRGRGASFAAVFAGFDRTLVLSGGRVAYIGRAMGCGEGWDVLRFLWKL